MKLDMKGRIRTVDRIAGNDFGDIKLSNDSFDIRISLKENKHVDEFLATLLHELLHIWVKLLKRISKVKCSDREEHKIIEAVESVVMYFVTLNLKRRRQ